MLDGRLCTDFLSGILRLHGTGEKVERRDLWLRSYTKMDSVRLVTNIYDRANEKLIWSGVSETMKPENVKEIADSLAATVIRNLRSDGLIR